MLLHPVQPSDRQKGFQSTHFVATSAVKQGPCCYTLYSHPTDKRGFSQSIQEKLSDVTLGRVGSVFVTSCSVRGGTVLMYTVLSVALVVLLLVLLGLARMQCLIRPKSKSPQPTESPNSKRNHQYKDLNQQFT